MRIQAAKTETPMNSSHAGSLGLPVVAAFLAGLRRRMAAGNRPGQGLRAHFSIANRHCNRHAPAGNEKDSNDGVEVCLRIAIEFRDPVEPADQPYPSGDSVTCRNCGRTRDLKEIRKPEGESRARPQQ